MTMTKPTSEQVTFTAAGSGATLRNLVDKVREVVSVKDFGAVGDGVADDTAAIQAAIDSAIATNRGVYVPSGTYKVSANLNVSAAQLFYMYGDGRNSVISATSAVTRIFDLASGIQYPVFRDMYVAASQNFSTTTTGFHAAGTCAHMTMDNVFINGCNIGLSLRNGWCNLFSNVIFRYCRTGAEIGDAANQCTFMHSKFWLNLYGLIVEQGYKVSLYGCLIEQNATCGIVAGSGSSGLVIHSCYFEQNGAVTVGQHPVGTTPGIPFTTPSTTVLCDIFVPGGGNEWKSGTMAQYAPKYGLIVDGCFTQPGGTEAAGHAFVYGGAAHGLAVRNCVCKDNQQVPALKTYGGFTYQNVIDAQFSNNRDFSKNLLLETYAAGATQTFNIVRYDDMVPQVNYAQTDLSRWAQISYGSVGTFERRTGAGPLGIQSPTYAVVQASTALTYLFGFQVNAADYPQNVGKLFRFSAFLKGANSSVLAWLFATASPGAFPSPTAWARRAAFIIWPASGTLTFGVSKQGDAGELAVANPILSEVGAFNAELERQFVPQAEFYGTAAPTTGNWLLGDRVWNTAPAAGGDPGWVCVTAGTPGTWKAMANVDA